MIVSASWDGNIAFIHSDSFNVYRKLNHWKSISMNRSLASHFIDLSHMNSSIKYESTFANVEYSIPKNFRASYSSNSIERMKYFFAVFESSSFPGELEIPNFQNAIEKLLGNALSATPEHKIAEFITSTETKFGARLTFAQFLEVNE